ncbi:CPBP family intramembrane glutamic endopeptidase [Spirosoma sp. 209]|uniref:CPBP family intramembrane glutamic endopeptidase n=1 Tax=Spirosoma sp. 209 TaxID=1955701 RepID=UPI00098CF920|nr:CPBP family intramembrane glutamic endopeptidase [Spirosoma sp. 209]
MYSIGRFYLLACAFSWACWLPYIQPLWFPGWSLSAVPHYLGLAGPMLAGLYLTWRERGQAGLQKLVQRMVIPRRPLFYGLVVPLLPLGLVLGVAWVSARWQGIAVDWMAVWRTSELPAIRPVPYLLLTLGWVGLGEETGWRGYALPRLLNQHTALGASGWLTLGWAVWHWPLFLYARSGFSRLDEAGLAGWLVSLWCGSILFTFLFSRSRGSILACALFHGLMDVAFMANLPIPGLQTVVGATVTVAGLVVSGLYAVGRLPVRGSE